MRQNWPFAQLIHAIPREWDDVRAAEAEAIDQIRHGHTFAAYDAFASHSGDGITLAERPSLQRI